MFPTPPLFWLVLGLTAVGLAVTVRWLQTHRDVTDASFHNGKLPGYSYTDGFNISLDASSIELPDGDWTPQRLETFHEPGRTRLILSVAVQTEHPGEVETLLERLADEMLERTEAQVVLLQAADPEGRRWEWMHSRDGRGWWGAEAVRRATRSPERSKLES